MEGLTPGDPWSRTKVREACSGLPKGKTQDFKSSDLRLRMADQMRVGSRLTFGEVQSHAALLQASRGHSKSTRKHCRFWGLLA